MKRIKLIITLIILCLFMPGNSISAKTNNYVRLEKKGQGPNKRPRMPSNQYLEFLYYSNAHECQFTFAYDIESMSVTIVEITTGVTYTDEVTQDYPIIYQDLIPGGYQITCIADNGEIYQGEIVIN